MSKMMNTLNHLNESRKIQNGIAVEDAPKSPEPIQAVREHKGIYFLHLRKLYKQVAREIAGKLSPQAIFSSFLIIALIAFSVFSLSTSLKTLAQLESSSEDSKIILHALNQHGAGIKFLESLITDNTSTELTRIEELRNQMNGQMNGLNSAIKGREKELDDMRTAHNGLKTSIQDSIYALKMSNKLILKKYILLNDKVKKLSGADSFVLNAY